MAGSAPALGLPGGVAGSPSLQEGQRLLLSEHTGTEGGFIPIKAVNLKIALG